MSNLKQLVILSGKGGTGKTTVTADGTDVSFLARDEPCELEAALSPVMPIRGQVYVGEPGSYRCQRDGTELLCTGPH